MAVRAGYNYRESAETIPDGLSGGFGFKWRNIQLDYFLKGGGRDLLVQGLTLGYHFHEKGRGFSPALQALLDKGFRQLEDEQYPEAVLSFYEALKMDSTCREAREGLERADRRVRGR